MATINVNGTERQVLGSMFKEGMTVTRVDQNTGISKRSTRKYYGTARSGAGAKAANRARMVVGS